MHLTESRLDERLDDTLTTSLNVDVSYDAGMNWERVEIDTGELIPDHVHFSERAGILTIAARACCSASNMEIGLPVSTMNGIDWFVGQPLVNPTDDIASLPDTFVAINRETDTRCCQPTDDLGSRDRGLSQSHGWTAISI